MAAALIPGSYPDSVPPTPDEPMQQPVQPEQHHHLQRNKLHKHGDHRGHKHKDSGVGITDPQPVLSSLLARDTPNRPEEPGGGGTHIRDYAQPALFESIRADPDTATPQQGSGVDEAQIGGSGAGHLNIGTSAVAGMAGNTRSETETSRARHPSCDPAPYWGDLPKRAHGHVYNRMVGHGSPTGDHSEQHQLPAKGGGVYNTVTGHGSQEEESQRHGRPRSTDGAGDDMTALADPAGDSLSAPLPDISEERQGTGPQATFSDNPEIVSGFLPETIVRDNVLLTEAASGDAAGTSMRTANTPPKTEPGPHRSLPLVVRGARSHEKSQSESPAQHGVVARTAGLGAGAATPECEYKRNLSSQVDEEARRSRMPGESNGHQTAGVVIGRRRPSEHGSPVEKARSHEQGFPKSEKKHKVLSIFHRHKEGSHEGGTGSRRKSISSHSGVVRDDAAFISSPNRLRKQSRDEPSLEPKAPPYPTPRADTGGESGYGKGNAAVAGVFGLLHRKRHSISEKPHGAPRRMSRPLAASAGGAGPAGEAPCHAEEVSTPFEHPREPPPPPDAGCWPGDYNVLAGGTPPSIMPSTSPAAEDTAGTTANKPAKYNTLASGAPHGINVVGATGISSKNAAAWESGDYFGPAPSGGPSNQATGRDVLRGEARNYSEKQASSRDSQAGGAVAAQGPRNYNVLAPGVPSGIKLGPSTATGHQQSMNEGASSEGSDGGDDSAEYNILSSGTLSGVKVKLKPPRHTTGLALHAYSQSGQGQCNTVSSGTVSGINNGARHSKPQANMAPRARGLGDLPAPANQHESLAATRPSHPQLESGPNRDQGPLPDISAYPRSELVHNMSPEVMPAAYTASAPRSSSRPSQTQTQTQAQTQAKDIEMVPPANSAPAPCQPAPAPAPAQREGVPQKVREKEKEPGKGVDPALAAATTSWATSAGRESGMVTTTGSAGPSLGQAPGQGRVVHKCLHCGRDNDISGYFAQFGPRAC